MQKTYLRRLHLGLAFIAGLFLLNLSISGALLVFAKEIQQTINPQYWTIPSTALTNTQQVLPLSTLVAKVEDASGEKIRLIEQSESPILAWQVRLQNNYFVNINPYTGDILLRHEFYDTFYGFVLAWHRWLLLTDNDGNRPFQLWQSIAALILIVEALIGCYLWLKPKKRLKRLKVKWQAKNTVRFQQLHGTLGILFTIPLILIAFSGMAFFWQDATKQVVEWLSWSEIEQHQYQHTPIKPKPTRQLDRAYNTAKQALNAGNVYRIYLPQKEGDALALRVKMPSESHGYSWSWANPYTGELLDSYDASQASIATKIWHFKYKFHIGDFIGWPIRVLWLMISLLPSLFVISGLYLWIKRRRKKRRDVTIPTGTLILE